MEKVYDMFFLLLQKQIQLDMAGMLHQQYPLSLMKLKQIKAIIIFIFQVITPNEIVIITLKDTIGIIVEITRPT